MVVAIHSPRMVRPPSIPNTRICVRGDFRFMPLAMKCVTHPKMTSIIEDTSRPMYSPRAERKGRSATPRVRAGARRRARRAHRRGHINAVGHSGLQRRGGLVFERPRADAACRLCSQRAQAQAVLGALCARVQVLFEPKAQLDAPRRCGNGTPWRAAWAMLGSRFLLRC